MGFWKSLVPVFGFHGIHMGLLEWLMSLDLTLSELRPLFLKCYSQVVNSRSKWLKKVLFSDKSQIGVYHTYQLRVWYIRSKRFPLGSLGASDFDLHSRKLPTTHELNALDCERGSTIDEIELFNSFGFSLDSNLVPRSCKTNNV